MTIVTWLDLILLGVMLISGLLAMVRGFMREILSITAWAVATIATVLVARDGRLIAFAKDSLNNDYVAIGGVIGGVFLLTLLIMSVITVKISDMVLDSRIGALDRTLGFLFGLARGLVIVVVAFLFFSWLVPSPKQPDGVKNAKSLEVLNSTGRWLTDLLPQDLDAYISKLTKKKPKDDTDSPDAAPGQRSDASAPDVTGSVGARAGYPGADRTDMRQLIDATKGNRR